METYYLSYITNEVQFSVCPSGSGDPHVAAHPIHVSLGPSHPTARFSSKADAEFGRFMSGLEGPIKPKSLLAGLFSQQQLRGLGGHCSHLSKQFSNMTVVRNPFLVKTSFVFA